MKTFYQSRPKLLFSFGLFICSMLIAIFGSAQSTGVIETSASVGESGDARIEIPLQLPNGTILQPTLTLNYSSHGSDGLLGLGWNLSGLVQSITRGPSTIAQDGYVRSVMMDDGDKLVLNGERLRAVDGGSGLLSAEYRLEFDPFVKIEVRGRNEFGPLQFRVYMKDGTILDFGYTEDSRQQLPGSQKVISWFLNRMYDRNGNFIDLQYEEENATGEYRISEIRYTGRLVNKSDNLVEVVREPYNKVKFLYEDRPDKVTRYSLGYATVLSKRLKSIYVLDEGNPFRRYEFAYISSGSSSRLEKVTMYGSDDVTSLQPVEIEWAANSFQEFGKERANWASHNLAQQPYAVGDFNGDGRADLISWTGGTSSQWVVGFSSGNNFNNQIWTGHGFGFTNTLFGDFDGDGKTDIAGHNTVISNNDWTIGLARPFNFELSTWKADARRAEITFAADFNGDGRTDLANHFGSNSWNIYLSTGEKFMRQSWSGTDAGIENTLLLDFNGDGQADLLGYKQGEWEISISNGSGFSTAKLEGGIPVKDHKLKEQIKVGDFNGDGLPDLVQVKENNQITVSFSTGKALKTEGFSLDGLVVGKPWQVGDFNGDGRTDIVQFSSTTMFFLSTGSSFEKSQSTFVRNKTDNIQLRIGDFNGDGSDDFGALSNGSWVMDLSVPNKSRVAAIRSGYGMEHKFSYLPMTNRNIYVPETTAKYPEVDYVGPTYVVSTLSKTDGVGGFRDVKFSYKNAKFDVTGRGFRGFAETTQIDQLANSVITTRYSHDVRYSANRLEFIDHYTLDNKRVKTMSFEPDVVVYPNKTYFSYYKRTGEFTFDQDGTQIIYKTTNFTFDEWGNVSLTKEDWSDGLDYSITTKNTYLNQESNWILGRLIKSDIQKFRFPQRFSGQDVSFEYDARGNLISETSEGANGSNIKTSYELDESGNRVKETVEGTDFSTRVEVSSFDPFGRYIISEANALGHLQKAKYRYGLPVIQYDENGRSSAIDYDAFGRMLKVSNPDGSWETTRYANCGPGLCPANGKYFVETNASGGKTEVIYFDVLNRKIREESQGHSGQKIYVDFMYNADGTLREVSDPYEEGSIPIFTRKEYDSVKRLVKEITPGDRVTRYEYAGLSTTVINPEGSRTRNTYNSQGKLLETEDDNGFKITYEYDANLNLIETRDGLGNIIKSTFNGAGYKESFTDPNLGGTYRYIYNSLGRLISQINPNGDETHTQYDLLDRPVKRVEKEATTEWKYDTEGAIGNLYQVVVNGNISESHKYDLFGRVQQSSYYRGNSAKTYKYEYESGTGRLKKLTYPNTWSVTYAYKGDYVTDVTESSTGRVIWHANKYRSDGRLSSFSLGNGLTTTRGYDEKTGYLTSITTGDQLNAAKIQHLKYEYSGIGNLIRRDDINKNLFEQFKYDNLNRLISTQVKGKQAVELTYDHIGNITFKSDVGSYNYGEGGIGSQILTSIDHSSVDGCTTDFGYQVVYNSFNYVSQIIKEKTKIEISYGPSRDRIRMDVVKDGATIRSKLYAGGLYEETLLGGKLLESICYIKVGDEIVGYFEAIDNKNSLNYFHFDHLGSVVAVTDEKAIVRQSLDFDAWGRRRNPSTWEAYPVQQTLPLNGRGYTFHEMLDIDWLICMNARIYNPILGRFLSPDPHIQFIDNPQSFNRFSYVHNNPISFTDPSGYFLKGLARFVRRNLGTIVTIGLSIATSGATSIFSAIVSGAAAGFGGAVASSLASGGGFDDALRNGVRGGLWGGISGGISYQIGSAYAVKGLKGDDLYQMYAEKAIVHGVAQGGMSVFQGGDFTSGFLGAATSSFGLDVAGGSIVMASIAGGTASAVSGGKFANGAVSAAFVAAYNFASHERLDADEVLADCPECNINFTYKAGVNAAVSWENGDYPLAISQVLTGFGVGVLSVAGTPLRSLGNKFRNMSLKQIDKVFAKYVKQGRMKLEFPDPAKGHVSVKGNKSYSNIKTKRSYNLDPGGSYRKGFEGPHMDMNYKYKSLDKKRMFTNGGFE